MPRHGDYNGWCRVQGIPNRSDECVECLRADLRVARDTLSSERLAASRIQRVGQNLLAENKALRGIVKRLRDHWLPFLDDEGWWWIRFSDSPSFSSESMPDDEREIMEALDG